MTTDNKTTPEAVLSSDLLGRLEVRSDTESRWAVAEIRRLRGVLAELVELRDLGAAVEGAKKNTFIGTRIHTPASEALFAEFIRRHREAWNTARDALRPNAELRRRGETDE